MLPAGAGAAIAATSTATVASVLFYQSSFHIPKKVKYLKIKKIN